MGVSRNASDLPERDISCGGSKAGCRRAIGVIIEIICYYKSLYKQSQFYVFKIKNQQLTPPQKQTRNGKPYEERVERRSQASSHLGTYHPARPNTHEYLSCAYQQEVQSAASLFS